MFAIVQYTDNTMENFEIIEKSNDFITLENKLQEMRKGDITNGISRLIRVIRIK